MSFSESQINAAYNNANLHGYKCPSRQTAINFLQWYFDHETPVTSEVEAIIQGLFQGLFQGMLGWSEVDFWAEHGVKKEADHV